MMSTKQRSVLRKMSEAASGLELYGGLSAAALAMEPREEAKYRKTAKEGIDERQGLRQSRSERFCGT
ncbi:MAG TPA: hypothetical protein VKM94_26430 [Blastocatellia bacterium]|nr:hypothetical protein [Blastocatellia bacterium]